MQLRALTERNGIKLLATGVPHQSRTMKHHLTEMFHLFSFQSVRRSERQITFYCKEVTRVKRSVQR